MAADNLTARLLNKRDEYKLMAPEYRFFQESYIGGAKYIKSDNLFVHKFEDEEPFKDRQMRAYFYNYSAPIVNVYNSFIYRQGIKRDFGELEDNELFQMFLKNADKQGNSYEEVVRDDSKRSAINGIYFWLVDKPSDQVDTLAQELEGELFPYIVRINPIDIWDWGLDEFGNLKWIKIKETPGDTDSFLSDSDKNDRFRIWDKEKWELFEIGVENKERKAIKIDEGPHPLGEVPVVPVCHYKDEPMIGLSLLNDIAYVNRALYNWCSLLDEILYRQTFSQLVFPVDPNSPRTDTALGTEKGLEYPFDSSSPPHFISPDASQATVLMNQIERGVEEIYRLATLRGAIGVTEQSSGVARSYDFMNTNTNLANKALNMEEAEMRVLRLWAKWQGIEDADIQIQYPRDFEVDSLEEEIKNLLALQTLNISKKFMDIQKKNLVKRMSPRLDKEDMEQIEQEIQANSTQPSTQGGQNLQDRVNNVIPIPAEQDG